MTLGQFVRLKRGDKVAFVDMTDCEVIGIDYKREAVRIKGGGHRLGWHSYKEIVCEVLRADEPKPISNCLQCAYCDFKKDGFGIKVGCAVKNVQYDKCEDFSFDTIGTVFVRFLRLFNANPKLCIKEFKKRVRRL